MPNFLPGVNIHVQVCKTVSTISRPNIFTPQDPESDHPSFGSLLGQARTLTTRSTTWREAYWMLWRLLTRFQLMRRLCFSHFGKSAQFSPGCQHSCSGVQNSVHYIASKFFTSSTIGFAHWQAATNQLDKWQTSHNIKWPFTTANQLDKWMTSQPGQQSSA